MLVTLCAPRIGLAEPAAAPLAPTAIQSPILGVWHTYRSDSVDNLASAVAYNSVRNEYLVVCDNGLDIFGQRRTGNGQVSKSSGSDGADMPLFVMSSRISNICFVPSLHNVH